MEVILNINNLEYNELFNNITLSFEKGKIITISGSNNSGKTTLSRILDRKILNNFNINLKGKDITQYTLEEYNASVQVVYPKEGKLYKEYVKDVISGDKEKVLKEVLKQKKIIDKKVEELNDQEFIWLQILKAISLAEDLVVMDSLDYFFDKEELDEVYDFLLKIKKQYKITFIMTTLSLEEAIKTDEVYILQEGNIILHGDPITVLQKDNLINKAGLNVPFMIDLSVKLRDYELVKDIILDKEEMVDALWN